jgi:hypothetical protein
MESKSNRLLAPAAKRQILRSKDIFALGIPRNYLPRLVRKGVLRKVGRGLYAPTSSRVTEHVSLVEAAHKVPNGVVCLPSALQFHKFTTQAPHQIWMAIGVKAWAPRVTSPPMRLVHMSGPALRFGVKEYPVRVATLKVYGGKNSGRLLQVPQQDRDGRGARGTPRVPAPEESIDGRALGRRQGLPSRERHAAVPGVALTAHRSSRMFSPRSPGSCLTSPESATKTSGSYLPNKR